MIALQWLHAANARRISPDLCRPSQIVFARAAVGGDVGSSLTIHTADWVIRAAADQTDGQIGRCISQLIALVPTTILATPGRPAYGR